MSDMGDDWRELKAESQRKRADNRDASARNLTAADIPFETHNGGAHLIVHGNGLTVDFWPGTGLWMVRGTSERRYGVCNLIKRLGRDWPPQRKLPCAT